MLLLLLLMLAATAGAQTKIPWLPLPQAFQAASWDVVDVPGGGLAPGSELVTLSLGYWFLEFPRIVCPTADTVSILVQPVDSPQTLSALFVPSSPDCTEVRAVLPPETPVGPADLSFSKKGQLMTKIRIQVVPTRFGIFTRAFGRGAALAQNYDSQGYAGENRLTNPALPGQVVTVWGTGLGPGLKADEVTVHIGGAAVTPSYAGPAPEIPGVDQINFTVPEDAANGCYVPVQVEVRGVLSNTATIAKANRPGACEHPLGLPAATLAELDAGGTVPIAAVSLASSDRSAGPANWSPPGIVSAAFTFAKAAGVEALSGSLIDNETGPDCRFGFNYNPIYYPQAGVPADLINAILSGFSVHAEGPALQTIDWRSGSGAATFDRALEPGRWRLVLHEDYTGSSLPAEVDVPPAPHWLNRPEDFSQLDRHRELTVRWDPAGYSDSDVVTVGLTWEEPYALSRNSGSARSLDCRAPATAGELTIPSSLLQQVPASPSFPDAYPHTLTMSLRRDFANRERFALPLSGGRNGVGLFGYALSQSVWVNVNQ